LDEVTRIRYIDGCRAVAILAVIFYHVLLAYEPWAQTYPLIHSLSLGMHGIDLFFVISGFCLSYPILAAQHRQGKILFRIDRFFAKRFVRLIPPYYVVLCFYVVVFLGLRVFHEQIPTAIETIQNLNAKQIVAQFLMLDRKTHFADGVFWTLCIEFRWYILFPILLLLWQHSKRAYGLLMIALIIAYHFTRATSIDCGTLPAFMLGIVAADWQINGHILRKYAPLFIPITFCLAELLAPHMPDWDMAPTNTGWHLLCFFFVVAAGSWTPLRMLLETSVFVYIGLISYSLYLVHHPIIQYFSEQIAWSGWVTFTLGICAAGLAGSAFWFLVERRFCHGHPLYMRLLTFTQEKLHMVLLRIDIPTTMLLSSPRNRTL
jgi:peptidoglycan/LPS O-acetylase OafA/YrhL